MERYEATLTSKGQITIPTRLRGELGLKAGDKIVFCRDNNGAINVEAKTETLSALQGIIRKVPVKVDGEKIARWIEESRGRSCRGR